jgi:hypothetical protein
MATRENDQFHSDIEKMFASYLGDVGDKPKVMIAKDGSIITKMNYSKVLFDSDLNIFKINEDGTLKKIEDAAFKAVVVKS